MFEILVGLQVKDDATYAEYRAHMLPLLRAHGGDFIVDVRVSEVLKSPENKAINRLFTIRFPSVEEHDAFFAHPEYKAVRAKYFEPSVAATSRIARYQVLP
jgi:uncharacterized protein (DUF1330 family)